jgi:hypothetical protein
MDGESGDVNTGLLNANPNVETMLKKKGKGRKTRRTKRKTRKSRRIHKKKY